MFITELNERKIYFFVYLEKKKKKFFLEKIESLNISIAFVPLFMVLK